MHYLLLLFITAQELQITTYALFITIIYYCSRTRNNNISTIYYYYLLLLKNYK